MNKHVPEIFGSMVFNDDVMRERLFFQPLKVEFLEGSDPDFLGTLKSDLEGKVHLDPNV